MCVTLFLLLSFRSKVDDKLVIFEELQAVAFFFFFPIFSCGTFERTDMGGRKGRRRRVVFLRKFD